MIIAIRTFFFGWDIHGFGVQRDPTTVSEMNVWTTCAAITCSFLQTFHFISERSKGRRCYTNSYSGRTSKIDLRVKDLIIFIGFQRLHSSCFAFSSCFIDNMSAPIGSIVWYSMEFRPKSFELAYDIIHHILWSMGNLWKTCWETQTRLHRLKGCRRCGTATGSARVMQGHLNISPIKRNESNVRFVWWILKDLERLCCELPNFECWACFKKTLKHTNSCPQSASGVESLSNWRSTYCSLSFGSRMFKAMRWNRCFSWCWQVVILDLRSMWLAVQLIWSFP